MHLILPILATIVGFIATWLTVVLLFASAPNSSAKQWAQIKTCLIVIGVVGTSALVGAIWLMVFGEPTPAALAGASPVPASIITLIVLHRLQQ